MEVIAAERGSIGRDSDAEARLSWSSVAADCVAGSRAAYPPPMTAPQPDGTVNPALRSWIESANDPATDFPIQNLPMCAYLAEHDGHTHAHLGVAIGDQVLDLTMLVEAGHFAMPDNPPAHLSDDEIAAAEDMFEQLADDLMAPDWTAIASEPEVWPILRQQIQQFLLDGPAGGQQGRRLRQNAVRPIEGTIFLKPAMFFNYTDFYASIHHATNVGSMFRPDNPLLPNYKHVPIGYHGRASSIVPHTYEIVRPHGQKSPPDDSPQSGPSFGPCAMLDYELELGCVIGGHSDIGRSIPISQARAHMLGLLLVNDWSARDIQKWEYQPLGPFLAKNFATTVSPFIVPTAALEPFRIPASPRPAGDPSPLAYLTDAADQASGGFDITVEAFLQSKQMADRKIPAIRLSRGSFRHMYWTFAQMIAHHASGGCNLMPGDLLASGTISGPEPDSRGCLLELTWDGNDPATGKPRPRKPIELPTGEKRTFLADGDTVTFRAFCQREGYRRIGFGECSGTIIAEAPPDEDE
jgi:fumarylacetoacetase